MSSSRPAWADSGLFGQLPVQLVAGVAPAGLVGVLDLENFQVGLRFVLGLENLEEE